MPNAVYNIFRTSLPKAAIDVENDTIKVMLMASAYVPNIDLHLAMDSADITGNEISGTGYSTGGETLANVSMTQDNTNDLAIMDADDVTWSGTTLSDVRGCIIYKSTGVASTSLPMVYIDFGSALATVAEDFKITWNTNGIIAF